VAVALIGAGSALTVTPANAAPSKGTRVLATDDAYTSSARRNINLGQADKLVIGRHGRDSKTSYLKFIVSPAAGTALTGADLRLVTDGAVTGTLTLYRVPTAGWSEKSLTAGTAPSLGAAVATGRMETTTTGVEAVFDLNKVVTTAGTYAFAVQSSATTAVTRFRSSESGVGAPTLAITTTVTKPVPTTPVPTTPVPTTPPGGKCVTGALLVPTCGVLWGAAAGGFTGKPRDLEHKAWEQTSGRTASIFHTYHKGDEVFPTNAEIAMTRDTTHPRVLLLNWRVEYGSTWANVAAGAQDARIDAFAARIKTSYPEKFFLALNHEPEDDVRTDPTAGMAAKDFAAMYRHVILRLRAKGVTNMISVVAYMGNEKWMSQSWWKDLYPGDDVVDWIGLDSYVSAEKGYYHYGLFADLLDRKGTTGPGFYEWATTRHPNKPIMIAEWGVYHRVGAPFDKAPGYASVLPELAKRPAIKAIVYFDTTNDAFGDRDISITSTKTGLTEFRKLAANPIFNVTIR
jgi:hypothetical protein